jgi:hypothetical protein
MEAAKPKRRTNTRTSPKGGETNKLTGNNAPPSKELRPVKDNYWDTNHQEEENPVNHKDSQAGMSARAKRLENYQAKREAELNQLEDKGKKDKGKLNTQIPVANLYGNNERTGNGFGANAGVFKDHNLTNLYGSHVESKQPPKNTFNPQNFYNNPFEVTNAIDKYRMSDNKNPFSSTQTNENVHNFQVPKARPNANSKQSEAKEERTKPNEKVEQGFSREYLTRSVVNQAAHSALGVPKQPDPYSSKESSRSKNNEKSDNSFKRNYITRSVLNNAAQHHLGVPKVVEQHPSQGSSRSKNADKAPATLITRQEKAPTAGVLQRTKIEKKSIDKNLVEKAKEYLSKHPQYLKDNKADHLDKPKNSPTSQSFREVQKEPEPHVGPVTRQAKKKLEAATEPKVEKVTIKASKTPSKTKVKAKDSANLSLEELADATHKVPVITSPSKAVKRVAGLSVGPHKKPTIVSSWPPLRIFYWNPNSVNSPNFENSQKKKEIITDHDPHVIMMVEPYHHYEVPGYKTLSGLPLEDRSKVYSTLLYKNEIPAKKILVDVDLIVVELSLEGVCPLGGNLYLFCIYLSHTESRRLKCLQLIKENIDKINEATSTGSKPRPLFIMVGDFNRDIQQSTGYSKDPTDKALSHLLKQFIIAHDMKYNEVTRERIILNGKKMERSRIDWMLFSKRGINVHSTPVKESTVYSDHFAFDYVVDFLND